MADIEVHVTELFTGETLILSADGREVFRGERMTTDLRKGLARIVRLPAPGAAGTVAITVEVPERQAKAEATVHPSSLAYIRVALRNGVLTVDPVDAEEHRREPRGYA